MFLYIDIDIVQSFSEVLDRRVNNVQVQDGHKKGNGTHDCNTNKTNCDRQSHMPPCDY